MKRQKRKAAPKKKQDRPEAASPSEPTKPARSGRSRRNFLENLGYGALGLAVVGGGGWYLTSTVYAGIVEQDLSRIGNGTPTVVQIHDPQCPRCRALQREARSAISEFGSSEIQFLVANIRQEEGRALASAHDVGHVTLLLFDGSGTRRGVLVGDSTSEILVNEFERLIRRYGES